MVSIVMVVLVLDTTIIRTSELTLKSTTSWPIALFTIISVVSLAGQNLTLRFIRQKLNQSMAVNESLSLNTIYKVAFMVHYALAAILVLVIFQMLVTSQYNAVLLNAAITVSYMFGVVIMTILSHRFFLWSKLNRSYVMSLYGLSFIMIAVNLSITLWLANSILLARPGEVIQHVMVQIPQINANPTLNYAYIITTITSFIVTWCATIGLLKNYIRKMRKFTYWSAAILPLAYFVSQFLVFSLGLLGPTLISNPIFYGFVFTIIFTLSKPIGGIIFGIGFWLIAKNIHKDNVVRSYLVISAYGFLLLFTSNQAILLTFTYYPPFGLATISFVGLSSYLVLVGIYSSAISISQDANLRLEIRRLAIRESKLLDSIGLAQIEEDLRKRVLHVARINKNNVAEAGIQSTLNEDEVNQYLDDVLKEIKRSKKEGSFTNENP
jgi:hypothetical protein